MFIDNQSWCLLQSPVGDSRCLYSCCLRPSEGGGAFGFPNGPRELDLGMLRFGFKRTPVSPARQVWGGEGVAEASIFQLLFQKPDWVFEMHIFVLGLPMRFRRCLWIFDWTTGSVFEVPKSH